MAVAVPSTKARDQQQKELVTKAHFFVRSNNKLNRLKLEDILWVHAEGNYCFIKTEDKKYAIKISLRKLAQKLSPREFIRIHKSYLVRTTRIDGIDINNNTVCIGRFHLPIGRVYKVELFEKLDIL